MEKQTTDFGFTEVKTEDKKHLVGQVFDSVADRYDLMNDLMSAGIHRIWKQFTVDCSGVRSGHRVLDLASGTGDLAIAFARRVGSSGHVVMSDINHAMLSVGRDKSINRGVMGNIDYLLADAQNLPFADNYFDVVTIAFGLRNVTDKSKALDSIYRVLKPGGRLLVLEFSKPTQQWLEWVYDKYSFNALPLLGKLVTNDSASYQYLAESIRMHPDQETLKSMMADTGFEHTEYFNLTSGIVALHRGYKF